MMSRVFLVAALVTCLVPNAAFGAGGRAPDAPGGVIAWGANDAGVMGDFFPDDQLEPIEVPGLTDVVAIAAGHAHALALRADGSVLAWGAGFSGQLGNGEERNSAEPVRVWSVKNVIAIAAGAGHSVAVAADGTMWAWGDNANGQLGIGDTADWRVARPERVPVGGPVRAVAAGDAFTLALTHDGTIQAWGANADGQLGTGSRNESPTFVPIEVVGLKQIVQVAAGGATAFARRADGRLYAWGRNDQGQAALVSAATFVPSPTLIADLPRIRSVAAGAAFGLALTVTGDVYAWGASDAGQLGDGSRDPRPEPKPVLMTGTIAQIAAGAAHALALDVATTVLVWGANYEAELGLGDAQAGYGVVTPTPLPDVKGVSQLGGGDLHGVLARTDGGVYAWGLNVDGAVGTGEYSTGVWNDILILPDCCVLSPVPVSRLSEASAAIGGTGTTFAILSDGTVAAWGGGSGGGQLGTGDEPGSPTPVRTVVLEDIVQIAAGEYPLALRADGSVWTWGRKACAEYSSAEDWIPSALDIYGAVAVATGARHALILLADGTVLGWGDNTSGQLALKESCVAKPQRVTRLTDVKAVAAGDDFTLFLLADGTVWGVGSYTVGQLGHGHAAPDPNVYVFTVEPVQARDLEGVAAIGAGFAHGIALMPDGTLRTWGLNVLGMLGLGYVSRPIPVPTAVDTVTDATAVAPRTGTWNQVLQAGR